MSTLDPKGLTSKHVLDGGLASELEILGADISGPLWSAHVLEETPQKVADVHRAYVEAGADVLLTASYQVSRHGYAAVGLAASRADSALIRSVQIARHVAGEFPDRNICVAASLGPFGATLHDGSEYHGNYMCSFEELVRFHRERIQILVDSDADLLAFETLPSKEEARAIGEALRPWPHVAVWFSFTCPDPQAKQQRVAHGEPLRDCAALVAGLPQTRAIGVNCTQPKRILSLIAELREASQLPIVVYPNSGESWDPALRRWIGPGDAVSYGDLAFAWYAAGAQLVGGCCRTGPEHIRQVAAASLSFQSGEISDRAASQAG